MGLRLAQGCTLRCHGPHLICVEVPGSAVIAAVINAGGRTWAEFGHTPATLAQKLGSIRVSREWAESEPSSSLGSHARLTQDWSQCVRVGPVQVFVWFQRILQLGATCRTDCAPGQHHLEHNRKWAQPLGSNRVSREWAQSEPGFTRV